MSVISSTRVHVPTKCRIKHAFIQNIMGGGCIGRGRNLRISVPRGVQGQRPGTGLGAKTQRSVGI